MGKILPIAVILLFIGVALAPSINAKVSRFSNDPVPDLDCEGGLYWDGKDLEPGDVLTGDFIVGNIGEPNSELDWRIMSCPFWGTWTFDPESGTGLTPEDGFVTVFVELILAVEINETLYGKIGIQNVDNESDICYIDIQIKKKSVDDELVEFDVEFCGLGKKHTVKLTQREADEVELLFDDIEQRLSEVETREDVVEIFKDAVVELDNYDFESEITPVYLFQAIFAFIFGLITWIPAIILSILIAIPQIIFITIYNVLMGLPNE